MLRIPKIQKYTTSLLILVQICSSLSSYSSPEQSIPVALREDVSVDQEIHSDMDILLRERALYDSENLTRDDVTVFQTESDLIGPSYMIREKSEIYGQVGKTRITSELLERTLVQNALRTTVDPSTLSIAPARAEKTLSARAKFLLGKSLASPEKAEVLTFEFGIEDTHLIFSEPVRLSVDTPDIPNGTEITLSVLHAGDPDWNTSGLMTDSRGSCLPDGSASVPATQAYVSGGKVEFFTCGASTFSLGYVPGVDFPNNTVWSTSLDAAGKLILAGAFTTVAGVARNRVARVDASGALDTTFADPNVNNIVYASAVQSDGKILIGGAFTGVTGTGRNLLARLNSDGTLDTAFNANITFVAGNQVRAIAIQSDGKILIGGIFTVVGGVARNRIARLNTDGTLDLTYNPNANNAVYAITLQGDGKALIGGAFTNVVATARNRLARINTGGTLDATWNPNSNNTVWDIKLFSDNTVALAGAFTTMGGVARNRIAKVSALGALDLTYNPNVNNTVFALTVESNNNLILAGQFTTVTAIARNRIARLTSTGVLDTTFDPNANNIAYTLAKDTDGNLLVGGTFTTLGIKSVPFFSWIGLAIPDTTPPQIISTTLGSGALLPIGNFSVTTAYTDTGAGINTAGVSVTLERWSGALWGINIAPTYLSGSASITTSTGIHTFQGVPYGKYRYRMTVPDIAGNTSTIERIFYVDAIDWVISQPSVAIGNISPLIGQYSAPSELTITVQTVGVPFDLFLSGSLMTYSGTTLSHWTGTGGYGYEKYASGYTNSLSSLASGWVNIASQTGAINTNGDRNIYTYRIQYGALVGADQEAGDYQAMVGMRINLGY